MNGLIIWKVDGAGDAWTERILTNPAVSYGRERVIFDLVGWVGESTSHPKPRGRRSPHVSAIPSEFLRRYAVKPSAVSYGNELEKPAGTSQVVAQAQDFVDPSRLADEEIWAAMIDNDIDVIDLPGKVTYFDMDVVDMGHDEPACHDEEDILGV